MIHIKNKGLLHEHTVLLNDSSNLSNRDNKHLYTQILQGNAESPMISYLMNLNKQGLNDFKSIAKFNELNISGMYGDSIMYEEIIDETTIFLPQKKFKKIKESFSSIILKRRSGRRFHHFEMSIDTLSHLLKYAFGLSDVSLPGAREGKHRMYSSGGALYPISVYLYINNVEGLSNGFYKYQPGSHTLAPVDTDTINTAEFFAGSGMDMLNSCLSLFFRYDINRNYVKYGELSLLNSFVEVGVMSHNFDLVATSLGFVSCPVAGFNKNLIETALHLDQVNEHIIFSSICGKE